MYPKRRNLILKIKFRLHGVKFAAKVAAK